MASFAESAATDQAVLPNTDWAAWGGTVGLRLNISNLHSIGITIKSKPGALAAGSARLTDGLNVPQAAGIDLFGLRESGSIQFQAARGSFAGFLGGSLQARGGYELALEDGSVIPLVDFRLRPNAGNPMWLDVVSGDGKAWFYIDKLMYELVRENHVLAIYTADMRISPELAERVGHPEMSTETVADLEILTEVTRQGGGGQADPRGTATHYHGEQVVGQAPGVVYQTDLFMQDISVGRVNASNNTGPGGNGRVVFAPNSTLRNNVNAGSAAQSVSGGTSTTSGTSSALWTAWVPWHSKFSGTFPPYNNDQHPFLIWNLYRINADASIEQIGRSGVKHAFLTLNNGCAPGENFDSHILGRSCSDVYSTGNNNSNGAMGFRSEIIPATNQWGRCHSLYDPGCVGSNTNSNPSDDGFVRRMVVNESQISNTVNPGATYLFDSWYLARQDINIYNSMATIEGTPTYSAGNWTFAGQGNFKLGSVTDRWVDNPPAGTVVQNSELAVSEGHTKVAVRVTNLGNNQWRYHYAVHDLDFSRAVTTGSEPNLEVVRNKGFDAFSVPLPAGASVIANRFSDGDLTAANDWSFSPAGGQLAWTAPAGTSLDWGSLYLFSVTLNVPPGPGASELKVAEPGTPATFSVPILVPTSDVIFQGGFESP